MTATTLTTTILDEIERRLQDGRFDPYERASDLDRLHALLAMARGKAEAEAERDSYCDELETLLDKDAAAGVVASYFDLQRELPKHPDGSVFSAVIAVKGRADVAEAETARYREQLATLRDLVQTLIDNDPDEPIADGGHVVLDLWRHDAKRALAATETREDGR